MNNGPWCMKTDIASNRGIPLPFELMNPYVGDVCS